ncbi:hypothetical protein BJF85_20140 [Saccharomonospora sp. CUA-673]|uniref:hypothetical protein n=1 Tax=Saccharomonospora sp. CUA-673 TaxID=1904969 RepID=UPI00095FD94D|nr:hypothetical protein [Saccharomonospora sp. CUA-673]OLT44194.1 hypothetical protein BJF85_20140 [Saccharomonospora sp. CUA-673]
MTAPTENEPRLRVDLPPGFAGIPITGSEEDVLRSIDRMVARAAETAQATQTTPPNVDELRAQLTALTGALAEQRIQLYGRFAVDGAEPTEPALATLTLAMRELTTTPEQRDLLGDQRGAIVAELARAYRKRVPDARVEAQRITLGPAVVAYRAGSYHFTDEETGGRGPDVRPEFKVEVQIPTPDLTRIIVLVVVTGSEAAWPSTIAHTAAIANSIRFDASGTGTT